MCDEVHVRTTANAAAAGVNEEAAAGRLSWAFEDARHGILEYPKHRHADAIVKQLGGDTPIPEEEAKWGEGESSSSALAGGDQEGRGGGDVRGWGGRWGGAARGAWGAL